MLLSNFAIRWCVFFKIIFWIFRWYLYRYYLMILIRCYNLVSNNIAISCLRRIFLSIIMCNFVTGISNTKAQFYQQKISEKFLEFWTNFWFLENSAQNQKFLDIIFRNLASKLQQKFEGSKFSDIILCQLFAKGWPNFYHRHKRKQYLQCPSHSYKWKLVFWRKEVKFLNGLLEDTNL